MVFKNPKTDKWEVRCYYKNYKGERKQKTKRGFRTKSEALDWERHFKLQDHQDLDMTIEDFFELYKRDVSHKVRPNTWEEKEYIILTKILPYLGKRKINELKVTDIFEWQREIQSLTTQNGKSFSKSYLGTIHNQLSAMLNHAVRYYGLKWNVASKAGNMGSARDRNVDFWTQKEYQKFIEQVADKPQSYYGFEILYWCGLRIGDDDDKIRLNQRKPSKYKGLSRFGPEKNLQRINKFMKERPTFYKKLIQMKENFRFYLRCFYCITKVVILQFNSEKQDRISS
ncbi:hypothetical protein DWW96_08570 [Eubacterium sp. AF17-7]|uniref:Arm DNA-binding domain-containing protein n=1 Tax=Eubacterium sp. AF17-7 TaxID=2293105 RepID=UPI000E4757B6|nr:Arm DNA-binding domain-containing protein [Eubacterium sp. AF17-7]RGG65030.1 hypothetical protein DWW96_08570 [Eubacterium sp. AF17-7]